MYIQIDNNKLTAWSNNPFPGYNQISEVDFTDFENNPEKYIVGDKEIEIDVPDYTTVTEEYEEPVYNDETGEPDHYETVTREVQQPVMIEAEEKITDEDGNEQTVVKQVQSTHKETRTIKTLVLNPNWEEVKQQQEKERIAKLSLTKREVFLALYRAKALTPDMVRTQITDTEALIEFDYATEYYRFNPLIDTIGAMLGYGSDDLDYLFINKELPKTESEEH